MPSRCAFTRKLTLFELLSAFVVIVIVLGVGLSFFSQTKKSYQLRANAAQLSSAVRLAQSFAVSNQGLGFVDVLPKSNEFKVLGLKTIAHWPLEDLETTGAFGFHGKIENGRLVPGKKGRGVELQRGQILLTDIDSAAQFSFPAGFSFEFYFFAEFFKPMLLLHQKGGPLAIRLNLNGQIEASCQDQKLLAKIRPKQWHHIAFLYDGLTLHLKIDHILQSQKKINTLSFSSFPLQFGSREEPVTGKIDDIYIRSLTELQQIEIPLELALLGDFQRIYFDERGRLSSQYHQTSVMIPMTHPQKKETIRLWIGLFGEIRQELLLSFTETQ